MANAHPPEDTDALLSAFLDGELDAAAEQALLRRLEQEPALQDALDELAETMAAAAHAFRADRDDADDVDVLAAVLAGLPAADVADTVEGAETLAWLVADGAADPAQLARLDTLLNQHPDEVAEAVAFVDAARATLVSPADGVAAALSRLPDHVGARVARAERAWSLSAGAADGALSAAEVEELVGLCSDAELAATFEATVAARVDVVGAHRALTEAFAAFAASPEVERLAARAGAAALQAIAAEAAQTTTAKAATKTTAAKIETASAPGLWAKIRGAFGQGFVPLVAASAAAVAFVVIDRVPASTGHDGSVATVDPGDPGVKLAEFRDAFVETVGPVAMANNTVIADAADLPVIADNGADVETLDAAGNTVVFQTAESNITVIWVAGLDDDSIDAGKTPEEQGT